MRILVVGSGAREHTLAWKCLRSPLADRVYVAPGNGGTAAIARNVPVPADDPVRLTRLARKEKALAEAAALLVLKKKLEEIYGEDEDDDIDDENDK